ncbi:alpha/beta fold hydrolase [Sphingomonas morindae]|uniref:Alpha/beta hydrolase n=1 Tax=Sphingomonas morindae TaxID=1541170 RepID=A0ABY4XAQ4_9SPHN|nr:alpha/beta hydrolase [Sphingomonas morindae]USI73909.1 alpha/beta hydrolase [Sphingomonas morindae]
MAAILTTAFGCLLGSEALANRAEDGARNIVLVHGAFADGSGWKRVADILAHDGYVVSVVQEPLTSLEDDVGATNRVLDRQRGPAVLVGHSYGGAIITEAGNNSHVASLVYVAAFVPDEGETVKSQVRSKPGAANSIVSTADGYLLVDQSKFPADFAADVPLAEAKFMALSQVPWNSKITSTPIADPAWRHKPAYAIVATQDRIINPDLERVMYARAKAKVTEIRGSHAVFISQPRAVADVIERAARTGDQHR